MVRPIVLHSCHAESTVELGSRLAEQLGVAFRLLDGSEGGLGAIVAGSGVVGVSSEALLDRAERIRWLGEALVVRVGRELDWGLSSERGRLGLVGDSAVARVRELLSSELNEAHVTVPSAGGALEGVVAGLLRLAQRDPVCVAAGEQSYLVEVGRGLLSEVVGETEVRAPVALYVTDANVDGLHGERLRGAAAALGARVVSKVLPPGEESKCLASLGALFETALEGGVDRSGWVIAGGGGVVTDISGLVAALWMRGLKWMAVPTTLLSMVDASVGGKTAVDFGVGKNAVGAFWQPAKVVCDVEFLTTEKERNYVGALSEVVKTALIGDPELFLLLEQEAPRVLARDLDLLAEVVRRCVQVKARVVGLDARESGIRATLNLGHTVGHALEALGEYRRYTHGEAVSLGLVAALALGRHWGYSSAGLVERVIALLERLGLPVKLPLGEVAAAAELLGHDKKRAGSRLKFVFAHGVGDVRVAPLVLEDLREAVVGLATR